MNCKPEDLAYTAAPFAGPRGVFVHVLRPAAIAEMLNGVLFCGHAGHDAWVCSGWIETPYGCATLFAIADECLRPIRDPGDDAVDESKAWLPPVPLPILDPSLLEVGK